MHNIDQKFRMTEREEIIGCRVISGALGEVSAISRHGFIIRVEAPCILESSCTSATGHSASATKRITECVNSFASRVKNGLAKRDASCGVITFEARIAKGSSFAQATSFKRFFPLRSAAEWIGSRRGIACRPHRPT